jgi:Fe-S cluster assembly protein SufD
MVTTVENYYVSEYESAAKTLVGGNLPWLKERRALALRRFAETGFPTVHQEAWRFTDPTPIAEARFRMADTAPDVDPAALRRISLTAPDKIQLVFINGRYAPKLSNVPAMQGLYVSPLAQAFQTSDRETEKTLGLLADVRQPFTALNTAYFADGAFIRLSTGFSSAEPIHLFFISAGTGVMSHPRIIIDADSDSKATVVETYAGLDGESANNVYLSNAVTEVRLGENARLDHYKMEMESATAYHIATMQVVQERSSSFFSYAVLLGGSLVRNNINVVFNGEGAEGTLDGLFVASGRQLMDTHTLIDHVKPHCQSHEYYKGILDGQSHGVFDGHIIVRPDAQKTDAYQINKNLLLSDDAKINTKPELKIFANDVKCKHGATVGQISADSLFYLRSRGIDRDAAKRLLINAFAGEIINRMGIARLREGLSEMLFARFNGGH